VRRVAVGHRQLYNSPSFLQARTAFDINQVEKTRARNSASLGIPVSELSPVGDPNSTTYPEFLHGGRGEEHIFDNVHCDFGGWGLLHGGEDRDRIDEYVPYAMLLVIGDV
jgi:hypothetical protein